MSEIKRYDLGLREDSDGTGELYPCLVDEPDGELVLHTDLARVERERDEARADVKGHVYIYGESIEAERLRLEQANAELRALAEKRNAESCEALRAYGVAMEDLGLVRYALARQTARVEALEAVVRGLEWSEIYDRYLRDNGSSVKVPACPICKGENVEGPGWVEHLAGHRPNCALAAALSQSEAGT